MTKKRSRDEAPQNSRKRQKSLQKLDTLTAKHSIDIDKLHWNTVEFPADLQDAEGFFGLEEISDVDVVKDPLKGKLEYRASLDILDQGLIKAEDVF